MDTSQSGLFDYVAPRSNSYSNAFDPVELNRRQQWFDSQKKKQDIAHPFWNAALQFVPFGLGNVIDAGIMAGIGAGRKKYQSDYIDKYKEKMDGPGFDYGVDDQGKFFQNNKAELPKWDAGMNAGENFALGLGSAVQGFSTWYNSGSQDMPSQMQKDINSFNSKQGGAGDRALDASLGGNDDNWYYTDQNGQGAGAFDTRGISGVDTTNNASTDWANGGGFASSQFDYYKKGGRMYFSEGGFDEPPVLVHGGSVGTDKIALVNTETGQDTGKRVNEGEMLVVSKETLDALNVALSKKDKKAVFDLMLDQVKQKPTVKNGVEGMVRGGPTKLDGVTLTAKGKPIVFEEDFVRPKNAVGLLDRMEYLKDLLGEGVFDIEDIDITTSKGYAPNKEQMDNLKSEARKKLQDEYQRLKPIATKAYREKGIDAFLPQKGSSENNFDIGTGLDGKDYFGKNFQYKSDKINNGEILKGSVVLSNNYSNAPGTDVLPMDAVFVDGQWYHQKDGKSQMKIDEKLQSELTAEYNKQASGLKYSSQFPDVVIKPPKKITPTPPVVDEVVVDNTFPAVDDGKIEKKAVVNTPAVVNTVVAPQVQPTITQGGDALQFGADSGGVNGYGNANGWQTKLSDGLGYGMDAYRMIQGARGAATDIPEWGRTPEWNDIMGRMKLASYRGFSPEENANYQLQQDRQYASDIRNINSMSGGSNAIALGNYGRANTQQMLANLQHATANAQMQRQNLGQYGGYVTQDMAYDRMLFGDKYSEAKQKEAAGAKLFNDAYRNSQERFDFNNAYGTDSLYGQLQAEQLKGLRETNQYKRDYNAYNKSKDWTAPLPGGMYDGTNPYAQSGTNVGYTAGDKYFVDTNGKLVKYPK